MEVPLPGDHAEYHVGRIGRHLVVRAGCPRIGIDWNQPPAHHGSRADMRRSYFNTKHVPVVGISGRAPG